MIHIKIVKVFGRDVKLLILEKKWKDLATAPVVSRPYKIGGRN